MDCQWSSVLSIQCWRCGSLSVFGVAPNQRPLKSDQKKLEILRAADVRRTNVAASEKFASVQDPLPRIFGKSMRLF